MAHAHCRLDTQVYKHTLRMCNTYCFATTMLVAGTRLNVMLCVPTVPVLFHLSFRYFFQLKPNKNLYLQYVYLIINYIYCSCECSPIVPVLPLYTAVKLVTEWNPTYFTYSRIGSFVCITINFASSNCCYSETLNNNAKY
jgi:hypothetical protein